jgi:hypothetical protein
MNKSLVFTLTFLMLVNLSSYSQTKKTSSMKNVTEFKVAIPQQVLDDLKNGRRIWMELWY